MAWVSNQPLREAFLESGEDACMIALRVGNVRESRDGYLVAEGRDIKRRLGLLPNQSRGKVYIQKRMREATALRYAEALGLDPVDIGL